MVTEANLMSRKRTKGPTYMRIYYENPKKSSAAAAAMVMSTKLHLYLYLQTMLHLRRGGIGPVTGAAAIYGQAKECNRACNQ